MADSSTSAVEVDFSAKAFKEKGNQCYKEKKYEEAITFYTKAIDECPPDERSEMSVYLKNRAVCHLKLNHFQQAIIDCVMALELSPGDIKALYRYAQGLEGLGKYSEAVQQLKKLLAIEPTNKEANAMTRRLLTAMMKESDRLSSTHGIVDEMYTALDNQSTTLEKKTLAAKNLGIISREEGGADRIVRSGGISRLVPYLELDSVDLVTHIVQTYVGLSTGSKSRSCAIIEALTLERVSVLIQSPHSMVATAAVLLLKEIMVSLNNDQTLGEEVPTPPSSLIVRVIQTSFSSLLSFDVHPNTRDCLLDLFVKTIPVSNMADVYLKEGLVEKVLSLSTHTSEVFKESTDVEFEELNNELWLSVSEQCRMNVSMVLSTLYDSFGLKDDRKDSRTAFKNTCVGFISSRLAQLDVDNRLAGLTALSTVLNANLRLGNEIFTNESVLKTALETAKSSDISCQAIAAEVLALASTDKSSCEGILADGLPVLKQLYHSKDDRVRVRAMVGLCKLGASSGTNTPFADGATLKLENTCRKFLVSKKKQSLQKWGAEGIAFLSLDANVKQALIEDSTALKVLMSLVNSPADKSLLYGIATIFVNLTNTYDKPERNPELEELGKYAGQNVPKEHEYDGPEYVKERVTALLKVGVVTCLCSLGSLDSMGIREQVSRTFLGLVTEGYNRGLVVQQGGVKTLITLTTSNTDIGKLKASQSLAKIGITQNPSLAFPGQRSLEVIRPFIQLLKAEDGLLQFEGLMALTNLSAQDEAIRQRIYKEGAIGTIEGLMFEENELIRRAATELVCNMIQLQEVHERFYHDDVERVKLLTLFSGEEDEALVIAASGGLAQLSFDPKICKKILEVKSSKEIFKEMLVKDNKEIKYRGMYVLANIMEAGKDLAKEIIEDDFLEIFMALSQQANTPDKVKDQVTRALKTAMEYQLIKPNPDL